MFGIFIWNVCVDFLNMEVLVEYLDWFIYEIVCMLKCMIVFILMWLFDFFLDILFCVEVKEVF